MKANYFETTLGFLTLLISFIFLIKLISVNSNDSSKKYYDLNAKFLKVGGLIVGNDVKMSGVKIGVVNQTTMLASETDEISNFLKQFIINKRGKENYKDFFADTRDTLCYATNENQKATYGLLEVPADLAIVVGGYNSSNTSHLVELCEKVLPTYFVKSEQEILSKERIRHFNYNDKTTSETDGFLPNKEKLKVIIIEFKKVYNCKKNN